ncbi:ABC transporter permease [Variovorax terrae]|uniref:ABC transporter permease n=1 Tax=Variovorax terrae TaxID=2923278 RepID=A0A9X1VUJ1_9BURK|nr:ABC transporter permease [Variovorax terrae]MCJ0764111.1 ABC transporter permease [Variovorax terrae]
MRAAGLTVLFAVLLFLLGPFAVIVAAGLSAGDTLAFPPQGLSLRWVEAVFGMENFRASFVLSLELGVGSTLLALLLGVPAAYGLARYRVPGREAVRTVVLTPVIVPGIIVGLALLRHAVVPLDMPVTLALVLAHTVLVVPYAVRVVTASLENLRTDVEEAAVMLGASRLDTFFKIVLPNIRNAILAAFILGFVTSFNQVPVSLFLTGPGITTLPIDMLASMEFVYDPSIAALSALMALMSMAIVLVAERLLGLSRYV